MKHTLIALALLFLMGGAAGNAVAQPAPRDRGAETENTSCPRGMHCLPFDKGNKNPQALAAKIRASLAKDPSGNSLLNPEGCKANGSCASPRNYLEALQVKKPELTLETLAAYLDRFKEVTPSAADYQISWDTDCLEPVGNGTYRTVINCMHRKPKPGEKFWVDDPSNPQNVFFEDCSNPRRGEHKEPEEIPVIAALPPCVTINLTVTNRGFGLPVGERMGINGPPISKKSLERCLALKRPSDTDFVPGWPRECSFDTCNFQWAIARWGFQMQELGSFKPLTPGTYVVRLPPEVLRPEYHVLFCEEIFDTQTGLTYHSDAFIVDSGDYRNNHVDLPKLFVYRTNPLPAR